MKSYSNAVRIQSAQNPVAGTFSASSRPAAAGSKGNILSFRSNERERKWLAATPLASVKAPPSQAKHGAITSVPAIASMGVARMGAANQAATQAGGGASPVSSSAAASLLFAAAVLDAATPAAAADAAGTAGPATSPAAPLPVSQITPGAAVPMTPPDSSARATEPASPGPAATDSTSSILNDPASTTALANWEASWRSAAATTPCGSCTGRACTVCSIRIGGAPATNGKPTGYAPRVLMYYDPTSSIDGTADTIGAAAPAPAAAMRTATLNDGADAGMAMFQAAESPDGGGGAQLLAAAAPPNAIVLENQKPGNPESEWYFDKADTSIEGYAAQFTIDHGQTVDFKINTDSKNYRIDIYRMGYYDGDGARKVATINRTLSSAQVQPTPLFDPTTKLVDAGNWQVSASWAIPADAVSGVYFANLTRLDGSGGQNMIPFIVRDDEAPSAVTFQTSDTTWQAYNWWGGYNFYGGIDAGGRAGRASAVSYNRPIISRDGGFSAGPQDFLLGEEYPAIRWLEENGYDINYISGIDTARSGAQLLNSQIFLSVGHDEYWSAEQRDNVEAARDAGVNLAFFSGNEVYWETRWAASIDGSGTPYKTLVSYKERWDNANTDVNGTTSTWRDPEFGAGEPENALTGTMFTVDSYRLDTMTIPFDLSNFRFWSNTDIADIQQGQVYSLTPNLLGYEWDSDIDNGFRPDGLVALSSTTVDVNTLLLDYGNTTGPGTATHSLTLYRAPSGALVFGAGTVYWSWGLDSHHDNEVTPADPNVQQAMVNLFADMGVQPGSLMQSLAVAQQTTDHTAPTSTITAPAASGAFSANQPIVVSGTATDAGGGIVAVVEVSTDGGANWHRATGFENWTYSFVPLAGGAYTIKSRAVDDSVNLETPSAGRTITVAAAASSSLFTASQTPANLSDADPGIVNLGVKFTSTQSGTIVGIKFYKGLGDGGTHVGSLWSATGTLLRSATFSDESAGGWQTVTFSSPVSIAAGTSYVASFNSGGHYANTEDFFTAAYSNGPLTAQAGNGYYTYAAGTAFPTTSGNGTNYFVDVIFSPTGGVNAPPVGVNDNGFVVTRDGTLTLAAATLLANDTDPNGDALSISGVGAASNGAVSFNAQTNVITFTPNAGYTGPASFGYAISDGHGGVGSAIVNMTVTAAATGSSLFLSTDTPANLNDPDNVQVNLGVKFVASTSGTITGIKYYKGASDAGTHTGSLWTSTGTLLATATFTGETTSGWQSVTFSSPVTITAGTTYVASFHSNGHYTSTTNYFTTNHVSDALTAPAAGNGVYAYGNGNLFPTSTFGASNYWVDVSFTPAGGTNQPPVAGNDSGFTTAQNSPLTLAAATLLANDTDANGDALSVTGASSPVNGTVSFNAQANTVTFTPTTGYSGAASFAYAIADGHGGTANATVSLTVSAAPNQPPVAGNDSGFTTSQNSPLTLAAATLLANDTDPNGDTLSITGASSPVNGTVSFNAQANTVTFTPTTGYSGAASFAYAISDGHGGTASATVGLTVSAAPNQPPVANNDTGFNTQQNTAIQIAAGAVLANDTDPNGDTLSLTGVSAPSNGTVALNAQTNIITFTPTAGYTGAAGFSYAIADGRGGVASANVALTVTAPASGASLFAATATPATITENDSASVELGMKFTVAANGTITGVRFYKGPQNIGPHTGTIWTSTGTQLGTVSFTNETASGWQVATFATPVTVSAATTYVVSYHANGFYSANSNYFTTATTNGQITAPSSASSGGNGLYAYGSSTAFPTQTYSASNYWVDVLYQPAPAGPNQPPVANNDSGFTTQQNTAIQIAAASILGNDTDPNADTLSVTGVSGATNGTVAFNPQTNVVTFTPTSGYTGAAGFSYAISDGHGGVASANVALAVTPPPTGVSLFAAGATPATANVNDPNSVELGMKFTAASNGTITGIRFYKGAQNVGPHTGSIWSSTGTRLGNLTFSNETASGWQTATFATPVAVTAGTSYVVSYHTNGFYSADNNYFATTRTNGPLTAPSNGSSGGNGVYAYGSASAFPTSSYNASNYWVDVIFNGQLAS